MKAMNTERLMVVKRMGVSLGKSKTGVCLFAFVLFTVMGIPFEILFYEFFLLIFKVFSQLSPCSKVMAFFF